MSLRPSRPLAGVTASQLWANSLDAGELIDKLDADNQTALVDLSEFEEERAFLAEEFDKRFGVVMGDPRYMLGVLVSSVL